MSPYPSPTSRVSPSWGLDVALQGGTNKTNNRQKQRSPPTVVKKGSGRNPHTR